MCTFLRALSTCIRSLLFHVSYFIIIISIYERVKELRVREISSCTPTRQLTLNNIIWSIITTIINIVINTLDIP